jgi:hypothetical protein
MNNSLARVDARYFIKKDLDVLLTAKDGTQRDDNSAYRSA